MERFSEMTEGRMDLLIVALLVILLTFAVYVYLYRAPLLSEYFAASAEKKDANTPQTA